MSDTRGETPLHQNREEGTESRREFLKRAPKKVITAAIAVELLAEGAVAYAVKKGIDILSSVNQLQTRIDNDPDHFFDIVPSPDARPAAVRKTKYTLEELTSHTIAIVGDSLIVGYTEGKKRRFAPEEIVTASVKHRYPELGQRWKFLSNGEIGKTLEDISDQVTHLAQQLLQYDNKIPLDISYSAGGNDVLSFLGQYERSLIDPATMEDSISKIKGIWPNLLSIFKSQYRSVLRQIVTLNVSRQNEHARPDKRIKRVFIYGLPNPMNMTSGPDEDFLEHIFAEPIKKMGAGFASQLNDEIVNIIEELQEEYMDIDLCYISLWNKGMNGVHLTEGEYFGVAEDRMERSIIDDGEGNLLDFVGGRRNLILPAV